MDLDTIIVVDVQKGFLKSSNKEHEKNLRELPQKIAGLLDKRYFHHRIFTTFRNAGQNSFFHKHMNWLECQTSPDIDIADELEGYATLKIEKNTYSAFSNPAVKKYMLENNIAEAYVCGIDTNVCVASMLLDLADRNIKPTLIEDLCNSHSGEEYHKEAIRNFPKIIGQHNITTSNKMT